jgi:hypothetical protein
MNTAVVGADYNSDKFVVVVAGIFSAGCFVFLADSIKTAVDNNCCFVVEKRHFDFSSSQNCCNLVQPKETQNLVENYFLG